MIVGATVGVIVGVSVGVIVGVSVGVIEGARVKEGDLDVVGDVLGLFVASATYTAAMTVPELVGTQLPLVESSL